MDKIFRRGKSKKEINLLAIEKTLKQKEYHHLGFTVYETYNGYRIAVTGKYFDPQSAETSSIMSAFKSDHLYQYLCKKQNCFRARLTPKPTRVGQKKYQVIYPDRDESQESKHQEWVNLYNYKSQNFKTSNKVGQYGVKHTSKILDYHDKICVTHQMNDLA